MSNRKLTVIIIAMLALVVAAIVGPGVVSGIIAGQQQTGGGVATKITAPVDAANQVTVQNAVHNAQLAVQTYLASNQAVTNIGQIPLSVTPGVMVSAQGTPDAYTITGTDKTGYRYTYTSTTGTYVAG